MQTTTIFNTDMNPSRSRNISSNCSGRSIVIHDGNTNRISTYGFCDRDRSKYLTLRAVEILAKSLKDWRRRKGAPLKSIALELNVSEAAVSDWENAKRFPTGRHLEDLSNHTGIPVRCLFCAEYDDCDRRSTLRG